MRIDKIIRLLICIGVTVLSCMLIQSCNNAKGEYQNITVNSDLCNFSLEYSTYYQRYGPIIRLENSTPSVYLLLTAPERKESAEIINDESGKIETVSGYRNPAGISIGAYDPSNSSTAPQTSQERIDQTLEGRSSWANFELLERSTVLLSGHKAEMVRYLMDRLMPIPVEDGENLNYVRAVYLDYDNLIWVIEAECTQNMMEQLDADFEHIIQTFKILN